MKYLFILIILLSTLVVISDEFELINLTSQSKKLEKTLSDKLNSKVVIDGGIVVKILPKPYLEIINLKVFDNDILVFSTNKVLFDIGVSELLNGFSTLNKVSARMNEASLRGISDNQYLKYLTAIQDDSDIIINVTKADVDINVLQKTVEITNLLFTSINKQIITSGQIDHNKQKIQYSFKTGDEKDISLNIDSDGFALDINLNDFNKEDFTLKDGDFNFKIKKVDSILQLMFDNYRPKKDNKPVDKAVQYILNASGDIFMDLNNEITLQNIKADSNFIDGLEIDFRLYKVMDNLLESYIYLAFDTVNLSYIKDVIAGDLDVNNVFKKLLSASNIGQYINLNFNLKLQKLLLNNGQINNIFLSTYHILNRVIIDRFDMTLPGESLVSFNGFIAGNAIRRQINGSLKLTTDDDITLLDWYNRDKTDDSLVKQKLSFNSRVFAMENLLKINRYTLTRGKEILLGTGSFYDIPYEAPVKIIVVDGTNIDLDTVGVRNKWDLYLKKLYNADSDKSGEEYFKLTNANHWLRSIDKHFYLSLKLQDTIFRDQIIPKISTMLEILPGELDVKNLTINSEKIDGTVQFKFILPVLRPNIISNINFKTFDLKYAMDLFLPKFDDIENTVNKINFLSANNYDAVLKLQIDNLIIDEKMNPQLVNGELDLRFGSLRIPRLQYSLWNGQFDISAAINLTTTKPTFDCGFSIYNIDPQEFFYRLTDTNKITGYMSFAGNIQGNLIQIDDFQRINGNIDFLGAQIIWQGFNIDKIIEIVDGQYTADTKAQSVEYYTSNGSTTFDLLKGQIGINHGLINIDNASISDKRLAGLFSMNFDLPSKSIESMSSFAFIPSGFTKTLTINFKTSGNIKNPSENTVDYKTVSDFITPTSKK